MLYDAKLSQVMAEELLKRNLCNWIFFRFVPKDKARIRMQLSAHIHKNI